MEMRPKGAEIVIIGGGVIGSAIAYFLSKAGRDVVLLERGGVGGEASVANGAFVWTSTRRPGIDLTLALASIEVHKQFLDELDDEIEYRRPGGMIIIEHEKQIPKMEAFRKEREEVGFILRPIDAKEARSLEPLLSESIVGALYNPLDGGTNPFQLMVALNRKAAQLGVKVCYHAEARGIEIEHSKVKRVLTDQGPIEAEIVVNACGSWASSIGKMVGVNIPVIQNEMEFVVTEQLPPVVLHIVMGAS